MKSLSQLITELKSVHSSYGRWGHMDDGGKLISGNDHPTGQMHGDGAELMGHSVAWAQEFPRKNIDSSWGDNLNWQPSPRPKLNLRTKGKKGLAIAIKHFDRFPHAAGRDVDWDHHGEVRGRRDSNTGHFGEKTKIHNLMKSHYEEYYGKLEESIVLEAESYHPYSKWGIVHHQLGVVDGGIHPTAQSHKELRQAIGKPHGPHVEYSQVNHRLCLRTNGKQSLALAIKYYNKLPHTKSDVVLHDAQDYDNEFGGGQSHEGSSDEVLQNMRKLLRSATRIVSRETMSAK